MAVVASLAAVIRDNVIKSMFLMACRIRVSSTGVSSRLNSSRRSMSDIISLYGMVASAILDFIEDAQVLVTEIAADMTDGQRCLLEASAITVA